MKFLTTITAGITFLLVSLFSSANEAPRFEGEQDLSSALARYVEEVSGDLYEKYNVQPNRIFVLLKEESSTIENLMNFFLSPAKASTQHPVEVAFLDGKDLCFIYGEPMRYCSQEELEKVTTLLHQPAKEDVNDESPQNALNCDKTNANFAEKLTNLIYGNVMNEACSSMNKALAIIEGKQTS